MVTFKVSIASFDQNQLRVSLRYYSPLLVCNTKQISTKTKLTNNIKDFSFIEPPIQPTTGTIFPCPRLQTLHLSEQNSFSSLLHKNIPRLFPSTFLPASKLSQHHEKRNKSFGISSTNGKIIFSLGLVNFNLVKHRCMYI